MIFIYIYSNGTLTLLIIKIIIINMRYLVVLNPSAAKGAALKNQTKIEKLLEKEE